MFRIGQKVVCIDDDWSHPLDYLVTNFPKLNVIYTVRGFVEDSTWQDRTFILLDEVVNPLIGGIEISFLAACFRPVVERKTDISIFHAMLNPSQVTVDAIKSVDVVQEAVR